MPISIDLNSALVVVDVQNDFCAGGVLAVREAEKIISVINQYVPHFQGIGAPIFATRDWHPKNHVSFKERGGPWPPHCLQASKGADLSPALKLPYGVTVISKGFLTEQDNHSGFQGTDFEARLKEKNVKKTFVCGLSVDSSLNNTVLDSVKAGFETYLLTDAVRVEGLNRGDQKKMAEQLIKAGAKSITLKNLAPPIKIRKQFMAKLRGRTL